MPLIERCITVDGNIVKEPKNVIAPIGTPLEDVFEFCGGFTDEPKKVLYGGPMMGIAMYTLDVATTTYRLPVSPDSFFISSERMRFALINSWSVSDDGRSMRHEAP